jgi:hypothetical protein
LTESSKHKITRRALLRTGVEPAGKTTSYKEWKAKFGDEAWSQLEKTSGKLV